MAEADPQISTLEKSEVIYADELEPAAPTAPEAKRKKPLLAGAGILAISLTVGAYLWLSDTTVSTDNAYVSADSAQITPLVGGPVAEVRVVDTQTVKRGDVLVVLDATDARTALAEAEAELARAERRVQQTIATGGSLGAQVDARGADIARARATVARANSDLERTKIDLQRRESLAASGAVSGEELTSARNANAGAVAAMSAAQAELAQAVSARSTAAGQLSANDALVQGTTVGTNPEVLAAKARVEHARTELARTIVRAPFDGVIAQRTVQVGQRVQPGVRLMTVVPVSQAYVDANFKEAQLREVQIGHPVRLTADLYGDDVVYAGRVVGIGGGTGQAFSLMPAQNASGNWVKVAQRLPVRIAIDPADLRRHPLRIGLSMNVEIDTAARARSSQAQP